MGVWRLQSHSSDLMSTHQVSEELSAAATLLHRLQTNTNKHNLGNAHTDTLGTFLPYMHVTSFSASLFYLYFLLSHTRLLHIYSSLQPIYCHSSLRTIYCHKPFQWQNILSYLRLCRFTFQYNKQRTLYLVSPQTGTESAFLPKLKNKPAKARSFSFQAEELLLSEDTSVTNFSHECANFWDFLPHFFPVSTTITAMRRQMVAHTYG